MAKKRFAKFPDLAARLREMSPEGRELIRTWHQIIKAGFDSFSLYAPSEAKAGERDPHLVRGIAEGARRVCVAWGNTLNDLSEVISDPSEADWCCAQGMVAYPGPCPQHVRVVMTPEDFPTGTVLRSPGPDREGRVVQAIKVVDRTRGSVGYYWRGVHHGIMYDDDHVRGWYYVTEVKP